MPMKYRNSREVKEGDAVVGLDHRDQLVRGMAIKGGPPHPEFIFQHGKFKTVCPSLVLTRFLHAEDAKDVVDEESFVEVSEALAKQASAIAGD